jgi:integrase
MDDGQSDELQLAAEGSETRFTYADVMVHATGRCVDGVDQQMRNRVSSLTKFLHHHGLTPDTEVGQELATGLEEALTEYLKARRAEGLQESSLANQRTHLKWWAKTFAGYVELRTTAPKFNAFHEAFIYFDRAKRSNKKLTRTALSRLCGKGDDYFSTLMEKKTTTVFMTKAVVISLEEALCAPPTALTMFIAVAGDRRAEKSVDQGRTEYGKLIQDLQKDEYVLKELPPKLLKEVQDFIRFKTAVSPALKRNMRWITRANSACRKKLQLPIISLDGKRFPPAGSKYIGVVQRFFGALARLGYDPEEFSLVYLFDLELVSEYLEFAKARVGNITKGHTPVLHEGQALLYSRGGWIEQQPRFGLRMREPVDLDPESWKRWCETRRNALIEKTKNLTKDGLVKTGRSVGAPIKDILERDHPLDALFELTASMESYVEKFSWLPKVLNPQDKATLERDIAIFKIIAIQPLRTRMFEDMSYRSDNSGNLYKRKTGEWAIQFKKEDFKNLRGAAKDSDYDVSLPVALTAAVDHYMQEVRPLFNDSSDKVFVPSLKGGPKGAKESRANRTHGTEWFSTAIARRSRQFLPGSKGFRPHAVRHIVATDYIKNNPGDYLTAAQILHDKIETVMKEYAHLKAQDGHKRYQQYYDRVQESWRKRA